VQRCIEDAQAVAALRQFSDEVDEVDAFDSDLSAFADQMDGIEPSPPGSGIPPPIVIAPPGPGDLVPDSWNRRTWEDRR